MEGGEMERMERMVRDGAGEEGEAKGERRESGGMREDGRFGGVDGRNSGDAAKLPKLPTGAEGKPARQAAIVAAAAPPANAPSESPAASPPHPIMFAWVKRISLSSPHTSLLSVSLSITPRTRAGEKVEETAAAVGRAGTVQLVHGFVKLDVPADPDASGSGPALELRIEGGGGETLAVGSVPVEKIARFTASEFQEGDPDTPVTCSGLEGGVFGTVSVRFLYVSGEDRKERGPRGVCKRMVVEAGRERVEAAERGAREGGGGGRGGVEGGEEEEEEREREGVDIKEKEKEKEREKERVDVKQQQQRRPQQRQQRHHPAPPTTAKQSQSAPNTSRGGRGIAAATSTTSTASTASASSSMLTGGVGMGGGGEEGGEGEGKGWEEMGGTGNADDGGGDIRQMMQQQTQQANQTMETLSHTAQLLAQTVAAMGQRQKEAMEEHIKENGTRMEEMVQRQEEAQRSMHAQMAQVLEVNKAELGGAGFADAASRSGSPRSGSPRSNSPSKSASPTAGGAASPQESPDPTRRVLRKRPTMSTMPVLTWVAADVAAWLHSKAMGMGTYAAAFKKEGVDGLLLVCLDSEALLDLGVSTMLHRNKIMLHIAQFRAKHRAELRDIEYEVEKMEGEVVDDVGRKPGGAPVPVIKTPPNDSALNQSFCSEGSAAGDGSDCCSNGGTETREGSSSRSINTNGSNKEKEKKKKSGSGGNNSTKKGQERKLGKKRTNSERTGSSTGTSAPVCGGGGGPTSPSASTRSISSELSDAHPVVQGTRSRHGSLQYFDEDGGGYGSVRRRELVKYAYEAKDDPDDVRMYNEMLGDIWGAL